MNHVRAIRPFLLTSEVCRALMDDTQPGIVRLRIMAEQINGRVEAGDTLDGLELRALVYGLHDIADKLGEMPQPAARSRAGWWGRIFG